MQLPEGEGLVRAHWVWSGQVEERAASLRINSWELVKIPHGASPAENRTATCEYLSTPLCGNERKGWRREGKELRRGDGRRGENRGGERIWRG